MAKAMPSLSFYFMSILLLFFGLAEKCNALTLALIHPNSQESIPSSSYASNQTPEDRIQKFFQQKLRLRISIQSFKYVVKIGIGTSKIRSRYTEYYLEMHTASNLLWTQCEGCTKCFKQTPKPFSMNKSKSFRPILCKDPLCVPKRCQGLYCAYTVRYSNNSFTSGILAKEDFSLRYNNTSSIVKAQNIIFGCGMYNTMSYGGGAKNRVAGVMGLGWGRTSFPNQIGYGKFSYCLPMVNQSTASLKPVSYLRLGSDIPTLPRGQSVTRMLRYKNQAPYYLQLQGISINHKRLNIDKAVFGFSNNGTTGGCIIDTGVRYSRIIKPAYDVLEKELRKYFSKLYPKRQQQQYLNLLLKSGLCYERDKAEGYSNLPTITFHFKSYLGTDLVIKPEAAFEVVDRSQSNNGHDYFCLAMLSDDHMSIIGTHQQTNQQITYDTSIYALFFYPNDCSKEA